MNGKSSSSVADQSDHADQAGQVQIKQDKCITSKLCRRNAYQADKVIYYKL